MPPNEEYRLEELRVGLDRLECHVEGAGQVAQVEEPSGLAGENSKQPRHLTGPPEIGEIAEIPDQQTIDVLGEPLEASRLVTKSGLGEAATGGALHERGPTGRCIVYSGWSPAEQGVHDVDARPFYLRLRERPEPDDLDPAGEGVGDQGGP